MFKSKKWLYFLVPLTLAIWGAIAYQIYIGLNPELPPLEAVDQSRFRESETAKTSLLKLEQPDKDPFLGTVYTKKKVVISKSTKKPPKKETKWPEITYLGYIKDKNSTKKVVAVSIKGKMRTFKSRQVIDSVELVASTKSQVTLKYKNQIKRFEKK